MACASSSSFGVKRGWTSHSGAFWLSARASLGCCDSPFWLQPCRVQEQKVSAAGPAQASPSFCRTKGSHCECHEGGWRGTVKFWARGNRARLYLQLRPRPGSWHTLPGGGAAPGRTPGLAHRAHSQVGPSGIPTARPLPVGRGGQAAEE